MPWGAAAGAAIGLIGNSMNSDKNGGAGASQTSKEPWAAAQPWLLQNIAAGQGLQSSYAATPLSPQQQAATANQYGQSDYVRSLVPSLLNQLQSQPLGYDKNNPTARAKPFDWNTAASGLLGQQSLANVPAAASKAPEPAKKPDFVNQSDVLDGTNYTNQGAFGASGSSMLGTGQYGQFTYGMPKPKPGTQAYRDMTEYFAFGGGDPNGLYGTATPVANGFGGGGLLGMIGAGAANGAQGSVGGSPASDGSGGGTPGGNW